MNNEPIKAKILADYKTLLALKFDSPQVIKDKFKLISEHIQQLTSPIVEESEAFSKADSLIQLAMTTEYVAFSEAMTEDDKQQTLAQLKHKAAEACQLLQIHS